MGSFNTSMPQQSADLRNRNTGASAGTDTPEPTSTPTASATAEGSGYQSSGMPAMAAPALLDYQAPTGVDPQSGIGAQPSALANRTITYTGACPEPFAFAALHSG